MVRTCRFKAKEAEAAGSQPALATVYSAHLKKAACPLGAHHLGEKESKQVANAGEFSKCCDVSPEEQKWNQEARLVTKLDLPDPDSTSTVRACMYLCVYM